MSAPPKVFISAPSGDLRSVRQIVKEALLTINCHPVEQTNFEPDWRTVEGMLRAKIEGCQALIHIVGLRYGAEPDPASLPPGTPRRSYTQMEYHLGCQLHEQRGDAGFRVYIFVCPEAFPFDAGADPEPEEKKQLQLAHRAHILQSPRLYEKPLTADDLQARILALQEQVLSLQQQQTEVRHEVDRSHRTLILVLGLLLVLGVLGGGGLWLTNRHVETLPARVEDSVRRGYIVDATKIRIQLEASSEKKRDEDVAAANDIKQHPKWDNRQKLREAAEAAHKQRVSRITEFAQDFADLAAGKDASPVLIEMGRIIETEGVDAALAYFETQRGDVMRRATSRLAAAREAAHRELEPLLKAASLQWTKGETAAARASFQDLLKLDPQWSEALEGYAWFLYYQTMYFKATGPLTAAVTDAQQCMVHAQRLYNLDPLQPRAQRVLSGAHEQMGDVLGQRGANGDFDQVFLHRQQSLALEEALYNANPDSIQDSHDVSVALAKLGDFFKQRRWPGDAETVFEQYTRSLKQCEKMLAAHADSAQLMRDVLITLNRLADFLTQRRRSGDVDEALRHYSRSLELAEKLLAANPDSAEAAGDVCIGLEKLGDFFAQRGSPGDVDNALKRFTRSLELAEKLLAARPDSAQAAREMSILLVRLGVFLPQRGQPGDAQVALKHFNRNLEITERLLAANPDSSEAARDVSVGLWRFGDFLCQRGYPGDDEAALKHFNRSLEITQKLLASNPDSGEAARDVSFSLARLGDFLARRGRDGDAKAALNHYMSCLQTCRKLAIADPDSVNLQSDLSLILGRLSSLSFLQKDYPAAGNWLSQQIELLNHMPDRSTELSNAYSNLAWSQLFKRNTEDAEASAAKAVSIDPAYLPPYTNLAHALLFQGKWTAAEAIYLKYKDTKPDGQHTWQETIKDDFRQFREAGHDHPDMKRAEKALGIE